MTGEKEAGASVSLLLLQPCDQNTLHMALAARGLPTVSCDAHCTPGAVSRLGVGAHCPGAEAEALRSAWAC